jgi:uncharacterized protein YneF (UPF0154 family)
MFFNGFTLLLVIIALIVGFLGGVRWENNFMRQRFNDWTNGESIEEQMKRDGWHV